MTDKQNYLIQSVLNVGEITSIGVDTSRNACDDSVSTLISISYSIGDLYVRLTPKQTRQLADIFAKHAQHAEIVEIMFSSQQERVEKGKRWLKEFRESAEA